MLRILWDFGLLDTHFLCSYLLKIVLGELVCNAEQLAAGVCVGEGPDAQTIGRI